MEVDGGDPRPGAEALAERCPVSGGVGDRRGLASIRAFRLSLNGERFVSDPETPLGRDDRLLLISADAGG